jgi:Uma2 family endonuclease
MVQVPVKLLKLEEFLQLPETKPASEFIDGQVLQKPMPQGRHSTLQSDLTTALNGVLKPTRVGRAYSELRCSFGGRAIVPDITAFAWQHIPRDADGKVLNAFTIAPDWTIEIMSPEQSQTKVVRNILHCLQHGSQLGWLIDPEEETVVVYFPDRPTAIFEERAALLPVPDFAGPFELSIGQLFSWLAE